MISVIIPTFNRAKKLRKCLLSLCEQTYKDFEVIVCDDGSKDDTKAVVQDFKDKLNIIYEYDTNFGGPARPRNRGLRIARGEFIAFLDSDDWWYPNKLLICSQFVKDFDLIYHDLDIYHDFEKPKGIAKGKVLAGDIMKDLLLNGNVIVNSSVLIRRSIVSLVGEISEDKSLIAVEDFDYWIRVAKVTNRFKYINQSLGGYWEGENISYSIKQIERTKNLLDKYILELSADEQKSALSLHHFSSARTYHGLGHFSDAKKSYINGLYRPSMSRVVKVVAGYLMCCLSIIKIKLNDSK
ncbi:glycosyltransferase family 2 protein [Pedobacter lithocola]|uniref:Glycosyltransferase family 2 protein n=1 Tax=Pedobacter lithocola TaxID=1908239 RepID=A0ABV8P6V6_9SPHI